MNKDNSKHLTISWILFTFLLWIFAFRGFLSSKFSLTSDATSYYDHIKFFVENLGSGVYPLWDPFWCNGAPNDFFLRRIGALNPFYSIILVLKLVGIPYTLAYLWFLAGYYWSGMIAFYLLAMRLYHNRLIAYGGYLILLFSALGTRLFDSYMMLVTVPLIWFFYFLVAFTQTPQKNLFLGMVLSLLILVSTYIPFYFLIILALFFLIFPLIFFKEVPEIFYKYVRFIKENLVLFLLSIGVLIFSFFPIVNFFHNSANGQIVLPVRHGDAGAGHTLIVPHKMLDWGAVEDFMYSAYFSNLKLYKFAVVYVPFFSVILFVLGLIGRINRRAVLMFLFGSILICSIVPHGLPFYDFFYNHIFILKYFRNLHFFIWFFLIPLFVLLVLEHWHMFTELILANTKNKWLLFSFVFIVHLAIFIFIYTRNDAIGGTYCMILLSFVFCSLMVFGYLKDNVWGFTLLTLTALVQPLEFYHYFSLKADPYANAYDYDFSYKSMSLSDLGLIKPENTSLSKEPLYYAAGGYNFIHENVSNYALSKYLQYKFLLVEHLEPVDHNQLDGSRLERQFLMEENNAIVYKNNGGDLKLNSNDPHPSTMAIRFNGNSNGLKILIFNANNLSVETNMPYEKFLIYNDSYDRDWKVSVNHHRSTLYEVNGAFKGVWLPAGNSLVEFRFGAWWQYAMNILLSLFTFCFLVMALYFTFEVKR